MKSIKVLVINNESELKVLIRQKFKKRIQAGEFQVLFAENKHEALQHLQANPDVCLVLGDVTMPEMDGLTLLAELDARYSILCTIIITPFDMQIIRKAMRLGFYDFLTKPVNVGELETVFDGAIRHIASIVRKLSEHKQTMEALRIREQEYRVIVEKMGTAVAVIQEGKVVFVNEALCEIFGETKDYLLRMNPDKLLHSDGQEPARKRSELAGQAIPKQLWYARHVTREGREIWTEMKPGTLLWEGKPALSVVVRDIPAHRRWLEEMKQHREGLQREDLVLEPCLKDRYSSERLWASQQYHLSMN